MSCFMSDSNWSLILGKIIWQHSLTIRWRFCRCRRASTNRSSRHPPRLEQPEGEHTRQTIIVGQTRCLRVRLAEGRRRVLVDQPPVEDLLQRVLVPHVTQPSTTCQRCVCVCVASVVTPQTIIGTFKSRFVSGTRHWLVKSTST